jgi:3-deoxy-D-manno-octulosonic-acid transferase
MRYLYTTLIYLLRPAVFGLVLWRGLRNRAYWVGLGERFGWGPSSGSPSLWVHAVSMGEVTAAAPLVHALRARYPQIPVILTTATPTGRARAQALFGAAVTVRFLPYDTPGSVRRFLTRARPRVGIVMETELWPNLFRQCVRLGIPLMLASARLSSKSVARYRRFSSVFGNAVAGAWVAAQTAEDAERFRAIGADGAKTRVVGNVKFDVALDAEALDQGRRLRASHWDGRPVWIAGSTHAGEEDEVLDAHALVLMEVPQALLLLVPRHPERFQAVADLIGRRGLRFERRSSGNPVRADCQVLLVDTVGELSLLYAAVDIAFVGGSLVPIGGHNLLEPAAVGLPVLTGPYQANAREIARQLILEGGALQVDDAQQLAREVQEFFADAQRRQRVGGSGRRVIEVNRGSVARLMEWLEPLIAEVPRPE